MKVLFTGMASSHCTEPANVTFFGLLAKTVEEFADVTWAAPRLSWTKEDLDAFDVIVFGLVPPTSPSANKLYGALHVLGLMYHSPKLRLVVDSQQIWQYKNSIESVKRNVNTIFGPFYSKKYGYSEAKKELGRRYIDLASSYMSSGYWPTTYYPSLPWNSSSKVANTLGFVKEETLYGVNLDYSLLVPEPYSISGRTQRWAVEDTKRSWYRALKPTLQFEDIDVRLSKTLDDTGAANAIRSSAGLIVPAQDRATGTWWSYRYVQALNSNTPIVTAWQDSIKLDQSWGYLAYQIEDMGESERRSVARDQLDSYLAAIKNKPNTIDELRNQMLELPRERTTHA